MADFFCWPAKGICFDIEHNGTWLESWGDRPGALVDAIAKFRSLVGVAPKLIPIYSHRYLPAVPCEAGNPVLSVYQTDIIYYGADLAEYIENDLGQYGRYKISFDRIRPIRFWDEIIAYNNGPMSR